ncbi:MAG: hypothetical protein KAS72_09215 [Phycisphaerales bacterium]|nr:hypothetical protein [Phycisphaerales bacterium]
MTCTTHTIAIIGVAVICFGASPLLVQGDADDVALEEEAAPSADTDDIKVTLLGDTEYTFQADLDDADGDVAVWRLLFGVDLDFPLAGQDQFRLSLTNEYSEYDFSGDMSSLSTVDTSLQLAYTHVIDREWSVLGFGGVTFSGEADADWDDAVTLQGGVAGRWAWNENASLVAGIAVTSRIEDDIFVLPYIRFDWQIDDRLHLAAGVDDGLVLTYAIDEAGVWTADISAGLEYRRFRLDDDQPGRLTDGVLQDSRIPIIAGVSYAPNANVTLRGYVGAVLWQEYEFYDSSGDEIMDDNTDPALMLGLNFRWSF